MGKSSNIEWCDHTFNPWIGCTKVASQKGCANCYAENLMDKRWGKVTWGKGNPRKRTSEKYWKQPHQWNKAAAGTETRPRVFCASLADVFDYEAPKQWRDELFKVIEETPNLDWLILTKRPGNLEYMIPWEWKPSPVYDSDGTRSWKGNFPTNVWLGISASTQKEFDAMWGKLVEKTTLWEVPSLFVSLEPLLGEIDLRVIRKPTSFEKTWDGDGPIDWVITHRTTELKWVIGGGESGARARPCHPKWARSLKTQCDIAGVPFFWKQWGEWMPREMMETPTPKKPEAQFHIWKETCAIRVGKKRAGHLLDGKECRQFPKTRRSSCNTH